jgi:hypothetical protein
MREFILITAIILFSLPGIPQSTCATSFKVNNGNGTCGAAGELRLTFPGSCPALVPIIDSVYINGIKSNVTFVAPDVSKCGGGTVATKNATITKGSNMLQLDNLSALSRGVYVAKVRSMV